MFSVFAGNRELLSDCQRTRGNSTLGAQLQIVEPGNKDIFSDFKVQRCRRPVGLLAR